MKFAHINTANRLRRRAARHLADERRNIHGVGREAHAERDRRFNADELGNDCLQLLVYRHVSCRPTNSGSVTLDRLGN